MMVNGKKKYFPPGITIYELIETIGFSPRIVMVKVDGKRIVKEDYNQKLDENSNVEIFSFIGGG